MSDKAKELAEKAIKSKKRFEFFECVTIVAFVVMMVLLACAAVAPPQWEVHESMFKVADRILAGMGICACAQALKYGRDASITIGKLKVLLDGNGDSKVNDISNNEEI